MTEEQRFRAVDDPVRAQLRAERERRGWSQYQLAAIMGVPQSSIASYESGWRHPPMPRLHDWCGALGFELTLRRWGER